MVRICVVFELWPVQGVQEPFPHCKALFTGTPPKNKIRKTFLNYNCSTRSIFRKRMARKITRLQPTTLILLGSWWINSYATAVNDIEDIQRRALRQMQMRLLQVCCALACVIRLWCEYCGKWKYTDRGLSVTELLSGHCHSKGHLQKLWLFSGAFPKLRKATISFIISVCPQGSTRFPQDGFS